MSLIANIGNHISRFLHHAVYSFPSAQNVSGISNLTDVGDFELNLEPGETKAMAGGVGPLSFAGSGYGFMLVLMGFLLNRITHIVRRPRIPTQPLPHPRQTAFQRFKAQIHEILTSHETPRYIRLPGLICLIRAWLLFTILTIQVANAWPIDLPHDKVYYRFINRMGNWVGEMQMAKVCWQVFLSVCAGLICSGLANGLDRGRRRDIGAGFNLFGYSFLLHLYSSPLTHHRPPPAANYGRPDINALFQIWLSLTELTSQLTWLQAIELSHELRRNQLLPTGVCGLLGLAHFAYALVQSPLSFPSFTFMTHLLALFLFCIITTTLILRGFTFFFTLGYIPSPVFRHLLPHEGVYPSIEDDFGVALLKMGTACLQITQFTGLHNEVATVEQNGPWLSLSPGASDVSKSSGQGFRTEITKIEVAPLTNPYERNPRRLARNQFLKTLLNAALGFLWTLINATAFGRRVLQACIRLWWSRWYYGPREWRFWRKRAWQEPSATRLRRHMNAAQWRMSVRVIPENPVTSIRSQVPMIRASTRARSETPGPSVYDDFLRGEVLSDEEDAERDWEEIEDSSSEATDDLEGEDNEPAFLRDLLQEPDESAELQPVLLAHMTSSTPTPLTRRRYNALITQRSSSRALTPVGIDMQEVILRTRAEAALRPHEPWDEDRRACVVCTIEQRDIILWPCRCLAMCNECRESLAARSTSAEHMCPCCRRKVDGFSRIYVP